MQGFFWGSIFGVLLLGRNEREGKKPDITERNDQLSIIRSYLFKQMAYLTHI